MVDDALKAERIKLRAQARNIPTYKVPVPRKRRKKTFGQHLKRIWEEL
jgi:hypothetical protein